MNEQFIFPKIQVRSVGTTEGRKVVVKGYAVAPNVPHDYLIEKDSKGNVVRTFKSLFTDNFVNKMARQMRLKQIFVDALHQTAANINIRTALESIKSKGGSNFDKEVEAIMANVKISQFPLGKPVNFDIDDNGMFVELELNPDFRSVDEDHARYYDAVVNSLNNGNLNALSINFKATKTTEIDGMEKIDDGDFYGISIMPEGALGAHSTITEVAMRSIMEVRSTMEETKQEQTNNNAQPNQGQETQGSIDYKAKLEETQRQLEAMKVEQEKAKQQAEFNKQMEELRKDIMESVRKEVGPKGVVSDKPNSNAEENAIKSREEWVEKAKNLSWQEKIQLQHELGAIGNEVAQRMGLLKKDADMDFNKR